MDHSPETAPEAQPDDQDVEAHSLLVEAQGRELHERRYRESGELGAAQKARSTKPPRHSRLRRLFGGE
jgi:hypothetical protein